MGYLKEKGIIILCIMQILCADCYGGIIDRPFVRITFALYLGVNINVYLCKNRLKMNIYTFSCFYICLHNIC